MVVNNRQRPKRKWPRRLARLSLLSTLVTLFVFWMLLQRKPAWYRPVLVDEEVLRQVRRDAASTADAFGDRLVAGQPFEMVLYDADVSGWLAAAPALWPRIAEAWPRELSSPGIRFQPGSVMIGALLDSGGWRVIAGGEVVPDVSDDGTEVNLRLRGLYAGSMPLPMSVVERVAGPYLDSMPGGQAPADRGNPRPAASGHPHPTGGDLPEANLPVEDEFASDDLGRLFSGIPVRNRFVWPNGKRTFRIRSIDVEDGAVRLGIEPLGW